MKNSFNYGVVNDLVEKIPKELFGFGGDYPKILLARNITEYMSSLGSSGDAFLFTWYDDEYYIPIPGTDFGEDDEPVPLYFAMDINTFYGISYLTPNREIIGEIVSSEPFTYAVKAIDSEDF